MPIPSSPPFLSNVLGYAADVSVIPGTTPSGSGAFSYQSAFPQITAIPLTAGGVAPMREDFNSVFKLLSQHVHFLQSGSLYTWSSSLDYLKGAHILGSNGMEYIAQASSGPNVADAGARDPVSDDGTFWKTGADTGKVIDGVSLDVSDNIVHYGVCDSAQAAQAKTVTIPGFRLVPGALAYVRFTHGNTHAAPTLDVSGTGAKPLTIDGTNPIPGYGVNAVASFMYDGARYVVVSGFTVDDNKAGGQTYLKFPNGSQIIWEDWGTFVNGQTVTFAQPFVDTPSLIGFDNESIPGNTERKAKFSAITETYFTVNDWAYGSSSKTGCWVAFGRWR